MHQLGRLSGTESVREPDSVVSERTRNGLATLSGKPGMDRKALSGKKQLWRGLRRHLSVKSKSGGGWIEAMRTAAHERK
jgi:hypothetical protein